MNRIFIIGNLTREPELRVTQSGISVCSFTVAVNRRQKKEGQPDADFFRVTAWRDLGENCNKYLARGRKVAVVGSVSVSTYEGHDGQTRAGLEVLASDVEFLSPKGEQEAAKDQRAEPKADQQTGFTEVDPGGDLPF